MSIQNEDSNVGKDGGVFYYARKANCEIHGEVGGDFQVSVVIEPTYTTGLICPKCYVDWVKANVRQVTTHNQERT